MSSTSSLPDPGLLSGLHHLEVYNFKSYKGKQIIGPFQSFTAVIGPNGAGKSNLMDAISFVLGVRSATLRSAALRDLIYRRGKKRGGKNRGKGKAKAVDEDEEEEEEEDEDEENDGEDDEEDEDEEDDGKEDGNGDVDDDGAADGERKAWVLAVYIEPDGKEWRFQRSISTSGASDYKLNNKSVPYKTYNARLESFHILVKAKNFLVFQGDVEAVAAQSPKDLAKLIDQISGSLDLKDEYDKAATTLAKATESSVNQHARRKGVNGEIKQYKDMKKEAERWTTVGLEKEQAVIQHLLWKLYHVEEGIKSNTAQIEEKNEALVELKAAHASFDEEQKSAKKDVTKAQKDAGKQEKLVKKREKELEESKPALVAIDAKIAHATKKLKSAEANTKNVEVDIIKAEDKLEKLQDDFQTVSKLAERNKAEIEKEAKSKGFVLGPEDLKEYHSLKDQASLKAIDERSSLNTLIQEERTQRDALNAAQDSLDVQLRKLEKAQTEEASLLERKATTDAKVKEIEAALATAKKNLVDGQEKSTQAKQTETELNEKLVECINSLTQAGADKRESERDAKFRETLANLKRTFPGVKGRVIDLCKPTQQKYALAVTTILGRNIDSIVVDNEKTAIACIEYLRVQRAGQATFIPLETIKAKPVNDKFRSFARGARLAIDVITYDASVEKAMQHSCGDGLVCDTMDIARSVCYDKGQEVKAVTLEGTVIHRSGLITGGNTTAPGQGRQFGEQEVEGLRRRHSDLLSKLSEVAKTKPRADAITNLKLEVTRLEAELTVAKDDLNATNTRLQNAVDEIKVVKKAIADLNAKIKASTKELDKIEGKLASLKKTIDAAEAAIFKDFCRRIKVANIREYEETQLRTAQEGNEATLKFDNQLAKLSHQIKFSTEQVEDIRARLATLQTTASTARETLVQLQEESEAAIEEQKTIEEDIEALRETLAELQEVLTEKTAALEEVRRKGSKSGKALDKVVKEIATCNDEIEKLASERFAVYRRCKLDEIELPLTEESESLDKFPIDEAAQDVPMNVDGEEETQPAAILDTHGVIVDFRDLDEEEMESDSPEMEEALLANIANLQAELDKMSPNRKAIERLGDSEARFKEIDTEFEAAREAAKAAKDAFSALKKRRCDLFNKAYTHISDRIDEVYKDLTKGTMAPMGGVAYLSLEDSEEPYLHGIKYHAMPPMKRFRDMDQLSGGEKTMAALALLFAIHSFHPSPFFVLDEVDAALDNTNVSKLATYIRKLASPDFQFVVISLKPAFFQKASALVGVYREGGGSKNLTLDLARFAQ